MFKKPIQALALSTMLLSYGTVVNASSSDYLEEISKYEAFNVSFLEEFWDADSKSVIRTYILETGGDINDNFYVPESFVEQINSSDNPVLEAKKMLYVFYSAFDMELELKRLNGEFHPMYNNINLGFESEELKIYFENGTKEMEKELELKLPKIKKMSEKEKLKAFGVSKEDTVSMLEYLEETILTEEEIEKLDQVYETDDELMLEILNKDKSDKEDKKDAKETKNTIKFVSIGFGVLVLLGLIIFIIKRKRRG